MADYIKLQGFARHLSKLAPYLVRHKNLPFEPHKVGVLVSGGADSMVMAFLLQALKHPYIPNQRLFAPKAFTVDHGARPESAAEALQVQRNLQSLGIDSEILKLTWSPGELENLVKGGFEEVARTRRYQAIARAARDHEIYNLFAGHHLDDQTETLLLRLIRNRNPNLLGFLGMAQISAMPCGESILAVRGESNLLPNGLVPAKRVATGSTTDILVGEKQPYQGQRLLRPLLIFPKQTILSTCSRFSIPYVDDKTNFDPTFTARNAVRYLRANYSLPKALTEQDLRALQRSAYNLSQDSQDRSQHVWDQIVKFRLDSHTGVVKVTLKQFSHLRNSAELRGFSYGMARLFELASPAHSDSWPLLLNNDHTMELARYLSEPQGDSSGTQTAATITVRGAVFRLINEDITNKMVTFMISRGNFRRSEVTAATHIFRLKPTSGETGKDRHSWFLWDRRFWIGVQSSQQNFLEHIVFRPYQPEDVPAVKAMLETSPNGDKFKRRLDNSAPGDARFTLPVMTYQGRIVAFPTLAYQFEPSPTFSIRCRVARSRRTTEFLNDHVFEAKSKTAFTWRPQEIPANS